MFAFELFVIKLFAFKHILSFFLRMSTLSTKFKKSFSFFIEFLSVFPVFCRKSKLSTSFSTICGKKTRADTLFFEFSTVFNYPDIEISPRYLRFPIFQRIVENTVEIFFLCCHCIILIPSVHTTNTQKNREVKTGCTLENGCLLCWQLPV